MLVPVLRQLTLILGGGLIFQVTSLKTRLKRSFRKKEQMVEEQEVEEYAKPEM